MAAQNESLDVLELLLTSGANVDQQQRDVGLVLGKTALHAACTWGRIEAARLLLAHQASIGSRDNDGQAPLHCACRNGHDDLVQLLLDSGVDLFVADDFGATPIDVAKDGSVWIFLICSQLTEPTIFLKRIKNVSNWQRMVSATR